MTKDLGFSLDRLPTEGGDIAIFTLHGRTRLNLVGAQVLEESVQGIRAAADANVRCAIFQGASEDAFIGGADLRELQALTAANASESKPQNSATGGGVDELRRPRRGKGGREKED